MISLLGADVPPARLPGGMAAKIEAARSAPTLHGPGSYPPEWPAVAWLVKTMAGWRCERCLVDHGPIPNVLTVHHLDGVKANLQLWNLAALCQRCHLRVQNRVIFLQDWPFEHSPWMARHVELYNEWALARPCASCGGEGWRQAGPMEPAHGGPIERCPRCGGAGHPPLLSLNGIAERSYANEWPDPWGFPRFPRL